MDNELVRYANGAVVPTKAERGVAKAAKAVYDEVRMTALKADGEMALAGHIMQKAKELDDLRRSIAQEDPVMHSILIDVEKKALQKAALHQHNMFDPWGM